MMQEVATTLYPFQINGLDSFFHGLSQQELEMLADESYTHHYRKGQIIFSEGNHPNGLYIMTRGKIKIVKLGFEGKEQIVGLAKTGDVIGYRELITGDMYDASAETLEPIELLFIPRSSVLDILGHNREFSHRIMKMLCDDLKGTETRMVDLAQKPVKERLADVLMMLKENFGGDREGYIDIVLSRNDLASLVGTATESVVRFLASFKKQEYLELKGKRIKILNEKELDHLANLYE